MQVARTYARALYEEAEASSKTDAVDADVELIRVSLADSRELVNLFRSPVIPREKKAKVVRGLFKDRLDPLTFRLLEVLVEKQREAMFTDVVNAYQELRNRQEGIIEARARVAAALSEEDRMELVAALERLTGKTVRLQVVEDEELIGGVVIRIGDTVYDGSVRHHLEMLREKMEVGSYVMN